MSTRRIHALEATTTALSWALFEADDFNVPRIDLVFATAPISAGTIQIKKDSALGAAYDNIIRVLDPVGLTNISFEGLQGFAPGDRVVVEYDNPDDISITGSASLELTHVAPGLAEGGLTADGGVIRSLSTGYAGYYHMDLTSLAPGGSGATFTPGTANHLAGWLLDSPSEELFGEVDIHPNWDTSYDPALEAVFTLMTAGAAADDVIKVKFVVTYASQDNPTIRTQTLYGEATVGLAPQYTIIKAEKHFDRNAVDNPILPGDVINIMMNVEADSDITAVLINDAAFYWPTTHLGVERESV